MTRQTLSHQSPVLRCLLALATAALVTACGDDDRPLATVERVDLQRYAGTVAEGEARVVPNI